MINILKTFLKEDVAPQSKKLFISKLHQARLFLHVPDSVMIKDFDNLSVWKRDLHSSVEKELLSNFSPQEICDLSYSNVPGVMKLHTDLYFSKLYFSNVYTAIKRLSQRYYVGKFPKLMSIDQVIFGMPKSTRWSLFDTWICQFGFRYPDDQEI